MERFWRTLILLRGDINTRPRSGVSIKDLRNFQLLDSPVQQECSIHGDIFNGRQRRKIYFEPQISGISDQSRGAFFSLENVVVYARI